MRRIRNINMVVPNGKFDILFEVQMSSDNDPTRRGFILRSKNADNPMPWRLVGRFSCVCFRTLADARQYCEKRRWE